jgi:hypothetical protein
MSNKRLEPRTGDCRRASRRVAALGLLACTASSLAGCGSGSATIGTAHIEEAIRASILAEHSVRTSVRCPPTVPRRAGETFTCLAHLEAGSYPVTVTETSNSGEVRYGSTARFAVIDFARVERAIARSILSQRHARAKVACPTRVLQQAGLTFTCIAAVNGRAYPFDVTETNSSGHVTYIGR